MNIFIFQGLCSILVFSCNEKGKLHETDACICISSYLVAGILSNGENKLEKLAENPNSFPMRTLEDAKREAAWGGVE